MPSGSVIRAKRSEGGRVDCAGDCGRRILLYYNPGGLCRKCTRIMKRGLLRRENRQKRGTYE